MARAAWASVSTVAYGAPGGGGAGDERSGSEFTVHGSNPLRPSRQSLPSSSRSIKGQGSRCPGLHCCERYSKVAFPAHVELDTTGARRGPDGGQTGGISNSNGGCTRGRGSRFGGGHPGHPAHPHRASQPSNPSWLPNLHVVSGFHADPSPLFQKVGSRKFQGMIVPASGLVSHPPSPRCPY